MIAIDANVLLRYLLNDDKTQSPKAAALIKAHKQVLITDVVLAETVWTLKGKKYKLDYHGISDIVNALFAEPGICFEDGPVVWRALIDFIEAGSAKSHSGKKPGKKQVDFADALIINKAKKTAKESGQPLDGVYTFDVAALTLQGTRKP